MLPARFLFALLGSATLAFAQTAFVPNDPLFFSGTDSGAAAGYYGEWHLQNQMPLQSGVNAGLDANVTGAWQRGLTGQGVIIAVVDDGVQGDHPDLASKFLNAYSWDFGQDQAANLAAPFRGAPVTAADNHGTAVAGVAAALGGNGIGVTGAAPYAQIASQRLLGISSIPDGHTEDELHAAVILYQGQTDGNGNPDPYTAPDWSSMPIKIKNHSYGIPTGFNTMGPLTKAALAESAEHGVIHVASAGNQAFTYSDPWPTADSNKEALKADSNVLTVSSLSSAGRVAVYSSYGANVFVTAPSDDNVNEFYVATTDRTTTAQGYNATDGADPYLADGNYTSQFGGTSSASPLVAGIMALGAQARPDLDVHLARQALARTSTKVDASDSGWITNAAGYHFNNKYGFGLINADGFTAALQEGLSISDQKVQSTGPVSVGQTFASATTLIATANAAFEAPLPLEYVKVSLTITGLQTDWTAYMAGQGTIAGDLSAWLVSPDGTRNQLFYDDRGISAGLWEARRSYSMSTLQWDFLSFAYFGEAANGLWTLELTDFALDSNVTFQSFSIEAGEVLAVPEPSAVGFLLLTGVALVVLRRRVTAA